MLHYKNVTLISTYITNSAKEQTYIGFHEESVPCQMKKNVVWSYPC